MVTLGLAVAACGGGDDEPEEKGCPGLVLEASEGSPLDRIEVQGIPDRFSGWLAARVTPKGGGAASITLVERQDDGGEAILYAPIHPQGRAEGGEVELEIVDEKGRSCKPVAFTILPLPEAPGATMAVWTHTGALLAGQAQYFGTTVDELRRSELADLPEHLLPLYLAQHSLDDPDNPNSLVALLDGTAPDLGGVSPDLDLLDRLLFKLGFPQALEESVSSLAELLREDATQQQQAVHRFGSPRAYSRGGPQNAFQLDKEMAMAQWGRGFMGDGGLAQATRGTATAVGLVGLVPSPHVKAGTMVLGTGIFSFLKSAEAAAKLLPSRFVSLDFELRPASMPEDDPSTGRWHDVMVVASSEGWQLDKAILETLLQVASVKGGYDGWLTRYAPEGFAKSLGNHLQTQAVNKVIDRSAKGSGIFTIPPEETNPIDITEDPWSFGTISFALMQEGRQGYRLDPSWEGGYEAEIEVATTLGKYGGQHIYQRRQVDILPMDIEIQPRQVMVDPGETVEFTITVRRAHDTSLSVRAHRGIADHQPLGGGVHRVLYTAPATEDQFPDILEAVSLSKTGLLANPDRPAPRGTATIRTRTPEIEISPLAVCVKSGESETFSATVWGLENPAVRWTVDRGTITSAGVYTAPDGHGKVTITATSVEDGSVQSAIEIQIGSCLCAWSATLTGVGSSSLSGDSTILSLRTDGSVSDLQFNGPEIDSAGTSDVLQLMTPKDLLPGRTGTWPVLLHGLYVASEHAFASEDTRLHLGRFEAVDRVINGKKVETYMMEGTIEGPVEFAEVAGRVLQPHEPRQGNILIRFKGHYDYPIMGMINCSGGYGSP